MLDQAVFFVIKDSNIYKKKKIESVRIFYFDDNDII